MDSYKAFCFFLSFMMVLFGVWFAATAAKARQKLSSVHTKKTGGDTHDSDEIVL